MVLSETLQWALSLGNPIVLTDAVKNKGKTSADFQGEIPLVQIVWNICDFCNYCLFFLLRCAHAQINQLFLK